jgi:hypothetical protein
MRGGIQVERAGQHTNAHTSVLQGGFVQAPASVIFALGAVIALVSLLALFRIAHERGRR